jgi:hypothetical protein
VASELRLIDDMLIEGWVSRELVDCAVGKRARAETKKQERSRLQSVASEFAGPDPSPVELVLAETAAINWYALRMYEGKLASAAASRGGITHKQTEFYMRCIDRTHRRLMQTVKTLVQVRRLALPGLQINLAQQINVENRQLDSSGMNGQLTLPTP